MEFPFVKPKYEILVQGEEYSKLLNRIKNAKIHIYNVDYEAEKLKLLMDAPDLEKIQEIIKKCEYECVQVKEIGFYFKVKKMKNLNSFLLGIFLFGMMLWGVSRFVWNIEFEGNYTITDEQMKDFLDGMNIDIGKPINKIDCNLIEADLRNSFNEVTWVCAEIKGTNLIVHIKENYNKEVTALEEKPYDLVAKHNSIVASIVTRSGVPCVKKGDIVKEGDLLISGVVDIYNEYEEKLFTDTVKADGDVFGKTTFAYHDAFMLKHKERMISDKITNNYYMDFFGYKIGKKTKKLENSFTTEESCSLKILNNFYIPVKIGIKKQYFFKDEVKKYSEEEAKIIAEANITNFLRSLEEKEMQILEKDVNIYVDKNKCVSEGTITVLEQLSKVSPINYSQEEGTTTLNERN